MIKLNYFEYSKYLTSSTLLVINCFKKHYRGNPLKKASIKLKQNQHLKKKLLVITKKKKNIIRKSVWNTLFLKTRKVKHTRTKTKLIQKKITSNVFKQRRKLKYSINSIQRKVVTLLGLNQARTKKKLKRLWNTKFNLTPVFFKRETLHKSEFQKQFIDKYKFFFLYYYVFWLGSFSRNIINFKQKILRRSNVLTPTKGTFVGQRLKFFKRVERHLPWVKTVKHVLVWLRKKYSQFLYFKLRKIYKLFFKNLAYNRLKFLVKIVKANQATPTKRRTFNFIYLRPLLLRRRLLYFSFLKMYKHVIIYLFKTRLNSAGTNINLNLNLYYNENLVHTTTSSLLNRTWPSASEWSQTKNSKPLPFFTRTNYPMYFNWVLKNYTRAKLNRWIRTARKTKSKGPRWLQYKITKKKIKKIHKQFKYMRYRILYIKLVPKNNNLFLNLFIKNKKLYRMLYTCSYGTFKITKKKIRKTLYALKKFKKIIRKFLKLYLRSFIAAHKPYQLISKFFIKYIILDIPQPFRNKYVLSILNKVLKKTRFRKTKFKKARNRAIPPIVYKTLTVFQRKLLKKRNKFLYASLRKPRLILASLKTIAHNGTRLRKPKRL